MTSINLDQLQEARLKTLGKKRRHEIVFGGQRFTLPRELPLRFGFALRDGDLLTALSSVLDVQMDAFLELGPTLPDFTALVEEIAKLYTGREVPESSGGGS